MNKIKTFFRSFIKSLTSIEYYKDITQANLAFSMKYLVVLVFIYAFFIAIIGSVKAIPGLNKIKGSAAEELKNLYPQELVITAQDGNWAMNSDSPVIIPVPQSLKAEMEKENVSEGSTETPENLPENLIVLDPKGTIDDLENYNAWVLVNSDNIIVKENDGSVKSTPLEGIENGRLDKEVFIKGVDGFINILGILIPIIIIFVLLALFVGTLIHRPIYLAVIAVILYAAGKMTKKDYNFQNSYKIAIHTMTLPVVLDLVANAAGYTIPIPLWFTLVNVIFGLIVMVKLSGNNSPEVISPVTPINVNGPINPDSQQV